MMHQHLHQTFLLFFRKGSPLLIVFYIGLVALISCNLINREYTIHDQYNLAISRIESMKNHLSISFTFEEELIQVGDVILFTVHFTNNTDSPLTLRLPQQSGVLDMDHPNTTLLYSISPLDKTVALRTPLSYLGMPFIFSNPVESNEFVILKPHATKNVKLELPNTVYLKQDETWVQSVLPYGQYLINISYENLHIGYHVERKDQFYCVDKAAWVGHVDVEPVLLTISR